MSTAGRISPIAKPGSLLKEFRAAKRGRRPKREHDAGHLALVRKCPCLGCDNDPAGEAAHLRMGTGAGTSLKADDRFALPLCHGCHLTQHRIGEIRFWLSLVLNPRPIADKLFAASPNIDAMRGIVHAERERRK